MWKWKDIPVVIDLKERKKFVIKYYIFYWSRQVGIYRVRKEGRINEIKCLKIIGKIHYFMST